MGSSFTVMDLCCQPVSDYGRAVFFLSIWRLCRVLCRQTMCKSAVWQYCDVCLALIFLSLCHMVFARCSVSYCFPVFLHAGALSAFLCHWLLEPSVTFCYMAATVIVGWLLAYMTVCAAANLFQVTFPHNCFYWHCLETFGVCSTFLMCHTFRLTFPVFSVTFIHAVVWSAAVSVSACQHRMLL